MLAMLSMYRVTFFRFVSVVVELNVTELVFWIRLLAGLFNVVAGLVESIVNVLVADAARFPALSLT